MELNIIILLYGLLICFGGIYIKKICASFTGFAWGGLTTLLVGISVVGLFEFDENLLYLALVCGAISAVVSAIFDKLCIALNVILSIFSLLFLILEIFELATGVLLYIIPTLISLAFACIAVKLYNYSFVVITAFTGAIIASCGGLGLVMEVDILNVLKQVVFNEEARNVFIIASLILAMMGIVIQSIRFKLVNIKKGKGFEENIKIRSEKQFKFKDFIKNLNSCFFVVEYKKRWYMYLIPILYVCSELYIFNGVLQYEIIYMMLAFVVFMSIKFNNKQLALWLMPTVVVLILDFKNYFSSTINIYLVLNFICDSFSSCGTILFACLFTKTISMFIRKKTNSITCEIGSIVSFAATFLSFLIKYYMLGFRNDLVPSEPWPFKFTIFKMAFLSIEVIIIYLIAHTILDIKNINDEPSFTIRKNLKNLIPTILLMIMCFGSIVFVNVIKDNIEESKYTTKYECYNDIIDTYTQAVTEGLDAYYDKQEYYSSIINDTLVMEYYYYDATIAYVLYDIDKNGIKELIISNNEIIYDIYTMHNNQSINLFPNETFGYRCRPELLNSGKILVYSSGGADSALAEIYIIKDGYNMLKEEAFFYDSIDYTYFLEQGYHLVSKDEFSEKFDAICCESVLDSLNWIVIY